MAFGNPAADAKYKRAARKQRAEEADWTRRQVYAIADQIYAAVYFGAPQDVIDGLLSDLRKVTRRTV